ncbi:MAG: alpha/beta hydrolase [Bacteroidota bacterium]
MRNSLNNWIYNVMPGWVERILYLKITHPRQEKTSGEEAKILESAEVLTDEYLDYPLKIFKWGNGNRSILLVNGWDGNPSYFAKMARRLSNQGYTVYAFEFPNKRLGLRPGINPYLYSQIIGHLIDRLKVDHVAAHCLGALATIYALFEQRNFLLDRFLLISPFDRFQDYLDDFTNKNHVPQELKHALISRLNTDMRGIHRWNMCDLIPYVRNLINRVLIIHDKKDLVVPYSVAERIAKKWHRVTLHSVENIGHREALNSPVAIKKALDFFSN